MNRREWLKTGAAALTFGMSSFPLGWTARADKRKQHILMYTKSEAYEHDVVKRKNGKLSLAERIVTELGQKHGIDVTCEKDGRVFHSDTLKDYDGFFFESQGDLCSDKGVDHQPPMPPEGKEALLKAIADGKGFVGSHCAADTFHTKGYPGNRWNSQDRETIDPYVAMIGGEFITHDAQQKSWMRLIDPHFPGTKEVRDFELHEEWYSLKNFAPDLHVILVQDTHGMKGPGYHRPSYPATWARMHHKGRVFYTSMGHRDDVWTNPLFQDLLMGGLAWALGNVNAEIPPNLEMAAPHAAEMPKEPPPRPKK